MELEDFEPQSDSTLEDFAIEEEEVVRNTANNSNRNKAAMSIALSKNPEQAQQQYTSGIAELEETGKSDTLDSISGEAQADVYKSSEESLVEGLLDPQIDDNTKLQMADNLSVLKDKPATTQELFIEKNIVGDGGESTEEQVEVRSQLADIIKPFWENKREVQKLVNSNIATLDSSTSAALADMIEVYLIPTAYNKYTQQLLGGMLKAVKGEDTSGFTDFLLAGESNVEIKKMLESVPYEKRAAFSAVLVDVMNNESNIYLPDDNDYIKFETMQRIVSGDYTEMDRWVDNVVGILDLIPVVGTLAMGAKALLKSGDVAKAAVTGASAPTSIGKVTMETNPIKGFSMVEEAAKDDEVAKALFGTSSKDVVVEAIGPKVVTKTVDPLHSHPTRPPEADKKVMDTYLDDGQIHYTDEEVLSAATNVESKFQEAVGLKYRSELSQIGYYDGLNIKAVYTAGDSGFSSVQDARAQAKLALRDLGIQDSEISILKRDAEGYNKTDDLEGLGDYVIQVDYKTKINPNDISNWSELDVKRNFLDRVGVFTGSGKAGSLQRHILDAHSMLHPTLTQGANVVVDKGALLARRITDLGEQFGSKFKKMDDAEKYKVESYIKKANLEGLEHTPVELAVQEGFNKNAIEALTTWRKTWDTIYWLENADLVRTLRSNGFKSLRTDTDNLFVRKTQMNFSNNRVYDPQTKKVETLQPEQMRELYANGGYVGQSRSRIALDGENIEHVLVKNDSSIYARGLRETDPVLSYRKGYYQVNYDAPKFIDKIVYDKSGKELYRTAVGMARDNVEAKLMLSKFAKADGVSDDVFGVVRDNKKGERMSVEDQFDMQHAQGRSSQRVRGERLQEPTQPLTGGIDGTLVQDPIDALTHAARSIGNRVSMRDWLESSKARFVNQFGDFLPEVKGQKKFPRNISSIAKSGDTTSKQIADARTTWEYINYMEGGYINSLDEGIKGAFRAIGNVMGDAGYGKSQRAMEWMTAGRGVTGAAKGTAFQLYIALNPARQLLVQSHQMIRLAALNPKYALGKMTKELAEVQGARLTGKTNELHKFVMDSGQIDSITRTNLLTDSLTEITHQSKRGILGRAKAAAASASRGSQKLGFEVGESNNVITSLLSFRDQAIRAGEDINNPAVRFKVYAMARNFTYNMTKAGDMPYNQNSLGIIMQFLQVPHKAITQDLFNRALTRKQRASALMFDTVFFGIPGYWAADKWLSDALPEEPQLREAMEIGIEGLMFNSMINTIADEHSELDFTSLSPTSGQGFADLFTRSMEEGLFALVSKSPSGQLLFGSNPRISNFLEDLAMFTGAKQSYTDMEFKTLVKEFVSMSSGVSNAFKMQFVNKYAKFVNSKGFTLDEHTTSAEALGVLFGLQPKDVPDFYKTNDKIYTKTKAFNDDVLDRYNTLKRQLALAGDNVDAAKHALKVMNLTWEVFGDHEIEARKAFGALIRRDIKEGDFYLIEKLFKMSGILTPSEWKILVQDSPIDENKKEMLLDIGDKIENYKQEE